MIAEIFNEQAKLYGIPQDDLANAVSVLQYEEKGMVGSAKEYRKMIVSSSPDVWTAAEILKEELK